MIGLVSMVRLLAIWISILSISTGFGQDWPQWRGPGRTGQMAGIAIPDTWPEKLERVWRVEIAPGISTPILVNNKIYILARNGDRELLICLNADNGRTLWEQGYDAPFVPNPQAASRRFFPKSGGSGPFATPIYANGHVHVVGVARDLVSFHAESGEIRWRRTFLTAQEIQNKVYKCPPCNMDCDAKTFEKPGECPDCGLILNLEGSETSATYGVGGNYYGAAGSPLVSGGNLITYLGRRDEGYAVAFSQESGEEIWRIKGPDPSSSSPVMADWHGTRQAVFLTRESCIGVAVKDGRQLWSYPVSPNAQIVTPVIHENLAIFATYRGPLTAIRVEKTGDTWLAEEAWSQTDINLYLSSPIVSEGTLYGFAGTEKGQFFAADAESGTLLWTSEGRIGQSAHLLDLGSLLLALGDNGQLRFIAKDRAEYKLIREYGLGEDPIWAHPVAWKDRLLVRDESYLTLWKWKNTAR